MTRSLLAILSYLFLFSCNSEPSLYEWRYYPSFAAGHTVKFSSQSKEISYTLNSQIFLADSIESDRYFEIMDSSRVEKIRRYIQINTPITKTPSSNQIKKLNSIFSKLCNCKDEQYEPGIDGTTHHFVKTISDAKNKKCLYWSPPESSKQGALIYELSIITEDIFPVEKIRQDKKIQPKTKDNSILIVSENPLYVRILDLPTNCDTMYSRLQDLPKANEIFIDLTEYSGKNLDCYLSNFYEKYDHLRWIKNEPFDYFVNHKEE